MERDLIKYFIQQVKQQQKDKEWEENNFITVNQFLKPYTIKPNTNQKSRK